MKIRNIQLFKVRNIKSKHLSNLDVSDFIVQNNIKTQTQLLATANIQKKKGKRDLASFVFSRTSKRLDELISQTWKMQNAQMTLQRQKNVGWILFDMDVVSALKFGWKWKLSRRMFIDIVSTLTKQRWNNIDRINVDAVSTLIVSFEI